MATFETWLDCDLQKPVTVKNLNGVVFTQDNKANKVGVIVTDGGVPVTLSGTVYGYVIRQDGVTVDVAGAIEETNRAYFLMPQEAYMEGHIGIVIKLTSSDETTTLGACTAYVYKSKTSNEVVPSGTPIPDLATVMEAIGTYAEAAEDSAEDAEAYALGTRGGTDVDSDDPAYHNNSKYYAEAAEAAAASASAAYGTNLLAPTYSATATYAVGDHVIYNGGYYECNTAISTAEAWNSSHWTQQTVGGETSALKSAVVHKLDVFDSTGTGIDLDISDAGGNVVLRLKDGHIQTKEFDSSELDAKFAGKQDTLTFDNSPTSGSNNPVKSGGIYTALSGKQDTLTFDNTPTAGSTNPVTSEGIKSAIDEIDSDLIQDSSKTGVDFDIADDDGYVVARFKDGHVQTKNFNSATALQQISGKVNTNQGQTHSGKVLGIGSDGNVTPVDFSEKPVIETFTKSGSYVSGTALELEFSEGFTKGDKILIHVDDGSMPYESGHRATYYENNVAFLSSFKGSNGYIEYIIKADNSTIKVRFGSAEYSDSLTITVHVCKINGEIKPKVVTVATDGRGMFNTIRGAIDSITDANAYTNPYEIWVYPGTYNTLSGYSDEEIADVTVPYTQTSFVGPKLTDGMSIKGVGGTRDEIILTATLDPDDWGTDVRGQVSTLNIQGSGSIENMTILAYNIRYCVHDDFRNPANQKTFRKLKNLKFGGLLTNTPKFSTYGAGMSTPRDYIIEDCDFGYTIGIHGNTNFAQECHIKMDNSAGYAFVIGDYADETTDAVVNYEVNNCNFERIYINRHYPSVTTPHTRLYGTGNEQTMVSCDDIFIWQFGNVVKIEAGFSAGDVVAHSSGLDTFEKTTNIDAFCGIVINADSNYSYVQKSGFVSSKLIGLTSLSIGDYITIDGTTKKAISGGTSANAIGVVTAVESDGTAFIRLRK